MWGCELIWVGVKERRSEFGGPDKMSVGRGCLCHLGGEMRIGMQLGPISFGFVKKRNQNQIDAV